MNAVGIDVSKGKSTVAIMRPFGEIVSSPFEMSHTEKELKQLVFQIKKLRGESKVIMEYTGSYYQPIANYLYQKGILVSVVNAILVHDYSHSSIRKVKTDRKDAIKIANYGLDRWLGLPEYMPEEKLRQEMNRIASQLPEYPVVLSLHGVGTTLGPQLVAEIGEVRRFYSRKALIAYAGIDSCPYQSGTININLDGIYILASLVGGLFGMLKYMS